VTTNVPVLTTAYGGYLHNRVPLEDQELTHVGPDTPGGEWFRRFWHPVAVADDLKDLPVAIRILGEDLVLFRDRSGRVGLLELHCSHRGTSLEFGQIQERGIRCCYHAWCYDVDGKILDTPGEPADSTLKDRLYHGAYPTHEYGGLVFAYMGPPNKRPEFPILDTYGTMPNLSGKRLLSNVQIMWPCNWLQVRENAMDPSHFFYLHSMPGNVEFAERLGLDEGSVRSVEWDYMETPVGMVSIDSRRVGDFVWVLVSDYILPNINQMPELSKQQPPEQYAENGYNKGSWLTWWTVPLDDTNCMHIGFWWAQEEEDRNRSTGFGQSDKRTYEERQRVPGDYDAQVSQRPIEVHELEHLAVTDRGILMLRNMARAGIRSVRNGGDPPAIPYHGQDSETVRTYVADRVFHAPPAPTPEQDRQLLRDLGRQLAAELIQG
jgi:phenylpropionate dioxygenase-like ring-hydroxylating dioxygenase large terminal subunit